MPTENDKAWKRYISETGIELDGRSYQISAVKLKEVTGREPRLLAKIDDPEHLPRVLHDNGYSLIAITNGSYLLFKGSTFTPVVTCATQSIFRSETEFPLVTAGRGSGESDYLDNAYNSGVLSDFTQSGKLYLTIRGRERSKPFDFRIAASNLPVQVNCIAQDEVRQN